MGFRIPENAGISRIAQLLSFSRSCCMELGISVPQIKKHRSVVFVCLIGGTESFPHSRFELEPPD
jgi:hypothetical protein